MYSKNQFINGYLVLVGRCLYELKRDILNDRYFVMNQNNELIYLDLLDSVAVVKIGCDNSFTTSFFNKKIKQIGF